MFDIQRFTTSNGYIYKNIENYKLIFKVLGATWDFHHAKNLSQILHPNEMNILPLKYCVIGKDVIKKVLAQTLILIEVF